MRRSLITGSALLAATLPISAPAAADSIVYLKSNDVWIANPDGSGEYQVTRDGAPGLPYLSVSQADDGTIAASRYDKILLLRQNGSVIRELDPPTLRNSYSHALDGKPVQVAISPDGGRIAYTFVSFETEGGGADMTRPATGFVDALGNPLPGNLYNAFPSWVTNTRLLTSGGYLWHVNIHDQGQTVERNWLNDAETDLSDPEVNRQGTRIALVRGHGASRTIFTFTTVGDVLAGWPARVGTIAVCSLGPLDGIAGPSWAPDGNALVWTEPDGLWTMAGAGTCTGEQPRLLIAGASQPDWGPANVAPGPREEPPSRPGPDRPIPETPPSRPGKNDPPVRRTPSSRPRVSASMTTGALAKRGLKVTFTCAARCTVKVTVRADRASARTLKLGRAALLGSGSGRVQAAGGAVTVKVSPSPAVRRRLAKLRGGTLSVRTAVTPQSGRPLEFRQRVRVTR
jgi:hypothetical protein